MGGGRVARPQDGLGGRHDRGEWQRGVDEGRAPTDHELEAAARGLDAQLQHEPGLADPRLTANHHRLGIHGGAAFRGGQERLELLDAADDDRARDPAGHGRDHTHAPH